MESVLVTGASGFIGAHLVRRLLLNGANVVGLASGRNGFDRLRGLHGGFQLEICDLRDTDGIEAVFRSHSFSGVYNLASAGVHETDQDPALLTGTNTLGSFNLGKAAVRHGVASFVHCGSAFEYAPSDEPLSETVPLGAVSLYGAGKAAGWILLDHLRRAESLPLITVRPFTVFGPGEGPRKLIPYTIRRALERVPINLTPGFQVRDYIYVSDVVEALCLAARCSRPGSVFNIGSGQSGSHTVRTIVDLILKLTGAPPALCCFGAHRRLRPDPPALIADATNARRMLGWWPQISLESGLRMTIGALSPDQEYWRTQVGMVGAHGLEPWTSCL